MRAKILHGSLIYISSTGNCTSGCLSLACSPKPTCKHGARIRDVMRDSGEKQQCPDVLRKVAAFIGLSGLIRVMPPDNIYRF